MDHINTQVLGSAIEQKIIPSATRTCWSGGISAGQYCDGSILLNISWQSKSDANHEETWMSTPTATAVYGGSGAWDIGLFGYFNSYQGSALSTSNVFRSQRPAL